MANVLDPQGVVRDIPDNMVNDAVQAGGKPVSRVQAPDKTLRWIPHDQLDAAQQAGGLLIPDLNAKPNVEMQPGGGEAGPLAGKLTGLPGVNPHTPTDKEAAGDIGLVAGGATAGVAAEAAPTLAAAGEALSKAAKAHPVIAKILEKGLEHVVGPGIGIAGAAKLLKLFEK